MFSTSRALWWHSTADKSVCTQQRALKGDTRPFTPINKAELMAFIGLNIAMGIVSLPAIRNWWNLGTPLVLHSNEQKSFYGNSAKLPCGWQHNSSQSYWSKLQYALENPANHYSTKWNKCSDVQTPLSAISRWKHDWDKMPLVIYSIYEG